jgi:hypothetical protein
MFGNTADIILALMALISIVTMSFYLQYQILEISYERGYMCIRVILNDQTICYK